MNGKSIRMGRFLGKNRNATIVAVDHGAEFGPTDGLIDFNATVKKLKGADGLLLNPGMLEGCRSFFADRNAPPLILRVTWTSSYCFPWNYQEAHTCQVMEPAQALAEGADVIMACCVLKTGSEALDRDNVQLFSKIAAEKEKAGIPLVGECYPLNAEKLPEAELHDQVYRGSRMLAELGADMIKTFYTGERFAEVAASAGVPVFVLGASKMPQEIDALKMAHAAVHAGARGVVFGRNVFQAADPGAFLSALAKVVNKRAEPAEALA